MLINITSVNYTLSDKDYITVTGKVTQYGRLHIEAKYFESILYIKSFYILVYFIN